MWLGDSGMKSHELNFLIQTSYATYLLTRGMRADLRLSLFFKRFFVRNLDVLMFYHRIFPSEDVLDVTLPTEGFKRNEVYESITDIIYIYTHIISIHTFLT